MRSSLQASLLFVFALFTAPAMAEPPLTAQQNAVIAAFEHHLAEINAGNLAAVKADTTPESTIIDGFPPFIWQGADPVDQWWTTMHEGMKTYDLDKVVMSLQGWERVDVVGDHAFAVANSLSIISGPKVTMGAKGLLSATLVLENGKWLISSWNWAGADHYVIKKS